MDETRIPILVGGGQVTQREADPAVANAAIDLTADAARKAANDAGGGKALLAALDTVVVIRAFGDTSWRFTSPFGRVANPPKSLASRLDAAHAKRLIYTHAGGNMPQWCVNRLSEMITRGEVKAALIAGGETLATQKAAQRSNIALQWDENLGGSFQSWGIDKRGWNDCEERHRMSGAIFAYPMIENAIRGARNRSIVDHGQAMGTLFARFAAVAAGNPLADRRQGFTASEIAAVGPSNPYIGFPYTKLMNANAFIDQAAAVILTSVAQARALGISEERWVYLHGCADAHDHWHLSDRKNFHSSPAMATVARETFAMADISLSDIDTFDLYSCFPSAVEIACAEMGIFEDDPRGLTVTGGLPYFGGPGNNYVTHAIAESMARVRKRPGSYALVTANGNYITKHSAGIYSTAQPKKAFAPRDPAIYQAEINADLGPAVAEYAQGLAEIETYTVMHDREGPSYAILFGRLDDGRRFIANTPEDELLLRDMTENDYLDVRGKVKNLEGVNVFNPD